MCALPPDSRFGFLLLLHTIPLRRLSSSPVLKGRTCSYRSFIFPMPHNNAWNLRSFVWTKLSVSNAIFSLVSCYFSWNQINGRITDSNRSQKASEIWKQKTRPGRLMNTFKVGFFWCHYMKLRITIGFQLWDTVDRWFRQMVSRAGWCHRRHLSIWERANIWFAGCLTYEHTDQVFPRMANATLSPVKWIKLISLFPLEMRGTCKLITTYNNNKTGYLSSSSTEYRVQ